jgi:hypothetical protein
VAFALITWAWHGTVASAAYCLLAAGMIAVSLIEYGGLRAPLSIAGLGTALGVALLVVGGGWQGRWDTVVGALIGTVIGLVLITVLRTNDPECQDPRGHGRSALLLAGCWMGGLGIRPTVIGAVVWIGAYFLAMVAAWAMMRAPVTVGVGGRAERTEVTFLGAPLVTALALSMVASLIARG